MLCLCYAMSELIYILSKLSCNKVSLYYVWYKFYWSYDLSKSSHAMPELSYVTCNSLNVLRFS